MNEGIKGKWKLWIGLSVLVLGLTYGVQMVQQTQENRSKAASEEVMSTQKTATDICGKTDGQVVVSRPIENLCNKGSTIWTDSVAQDGDYNWSCMDDAGVLLSDCSAFLED